MVGLVVDGVVVVGIEVFAEVVVLMFGGPAAVASSLVPGVVAAL